MRFRQAHKSTTYGVAVSSFCAVAFSGLLPIVLILLGAIAIAVSWRWEPPRVRYQKWELAWTIVAALVFIFQVLSVLVGAEVIIAGSNFLLFLLIVKLFNRKESKDYLHIYVLSFLMLTAGTVLNAGISYGFFFLCYVVFSTWALIILHLRRELENNFLLRHSGENEAERARVERVMNSTRIVGRKFFIGTGLVSLAVFLGALGLFLLFPRIGFGLFFDKGRGGVTMSGFSDGVELGGHGVIKKDSTVVMRVEVSPEYRGRNAPPLHWRGVAFDSYQGGRWSRSRNAPVTKIFTDPRKNSTKYHLVYDQVNLRQADVDARFEGSLAQDIYLEPLGSDALFGASMPLAMEFEKKIGSQPRAGRNDELRQSHGAGIKYTVYSDPTPPSPAELRTAPSGIPYANTAFLRSYDTYLQLPAEIPECATRDPNRALSDFAPECRVRELARFITKDATNNYDKALALETWLRSELDYTLQMESPGDMEPVEFFLFERKRGHCEYFSSAMSIMARSVGVPVRNVNGFLGGEWNEYDNYIAVRAGDAHSWVEVYFEGQGWVTFDPTPAGEVDWLGRGSSSFLDRMRRIGDTIKFKWFKWVIEYDLYQQLKLFKGVGDSLKGSANKYFKEPLKDVRTWAKRNQGRAAGVVIAIGLAIFVFAWRRRRRHGLGPKTSRRGGRVRDPVVMQYQAATKLLAKLGLRRSDATTPREFAARLREDKVAGADSFDTLTEIYYRAEYSAAGFADISRAKDLRQELASALRESKTKKQRLPAL